MTNSAVALPFSREEFFDVFASYNHAVWPAQFVLVLAAIGCFVAIASNRGRAAPVGWVLAFLWAWMAVVYHFAFFSGINPAAWIFGGAFVVASALFAFHTQSGKLSFGGFRGLPGAIGLALISYALVGYPLVGMLNGHAFPRVPTFGLPCPTTIFTLGVLVSARPPAPVSAFIVPLVWSFVGTVAAVQLGVVQDFGLPVTALATVAVLALRHRRLPLGRVRL